MATTKERSEIVERFINAFDAVHINDHEYEGEDKPAWISDDNSIMLVSKDVEQFNYLNITHIDSEPNEIREATTENDDGETVSLVGFHQKGNNNTDWVKMDNARNATEVLGVELAIENIRIRRRLTASHWPISIEGENYRIIMAPFVYDE